MRNLGTLFCANCGIECRKNGAMQIYCPSCSELKDLERKRKWAQEHPLNKEQVEQRNKSMRARKEKSREAGLIANERNKFSIAWNAPSLPILLWMSRIAVPFTFAASKNHIYRMGGGGHVFLRKESKAIRNKITRMFGYALRNRKVANNKLWLDILVQKPSHKGDAVNVVDLVCDAIKDAIALDDNWYCIRKLDWQIVKNNPQLYIGVGQDTFEDCQVCSYCGQIKPFSEFNKNKQSKLGVGRECKECRRIGRQFAKAQKTERT